MAIEAIYIKSNGNQALVENKCLPIPRCIVAESGHARKIGGDFAHFVRISGENATFQKKMAAKLSLKLFYSKRIEILRSQRMHFNPPRNFVIATTRLLF